EVDGCLNVHDTEHGVRAVFDGRRAGGDAHRLDDAARQRAQVDPAVPGYAQGGAVEIDAGLALLGTAQSQNGLAARVRANTQRRQAFENIGERHRRALLDLRVVDLDGGLESAA